MYERIRALREDRDLLHAMAEKATKTAVVSEGRVSLSARTLAALPHPVAVRAVKQLLAKVYSNYELGQRDIPTAILIALADFYDTSTDYILGRTDEK